MAKKMKLALHIGTEKTGTTLLQEWLYHNRERLGQQGYFLSEKIGLPCNRNIVSYFRRAPDDFWNRYNIRSLDDKARFFAHFLEDLQAELDQAAQTNHTVIMSSEHFHSRLHDPEDLAAFAAYCKETFSEVQVICYLRPQWDVRKSLYSTGLKTNSAVEFHEFSDNLSADSHYYNYLDLYHRWGENFGYDSLDFRLYDRKNFAEGDLRRDFLEAVGGSIDAEALDFSIESANESVKLLLGYALIGINKAVPLFSGGGMDKRNYYYKSIVNQLDLLNTGTIADERTLEVAETFHDSNAQLAKEAFDREELFPEPKEKVAQEETFTAQEVAHIIERLVFMYTRRTSRRMLFDEDADVLRDVALKYAKGDPVTRDEALKLMTLAARARPNGGLIQQKLAEWSEEE
jgi:hypothetical protein